MAEPKQDPRAPLTAAPGPEAVVVRCPLCGTPHAETDPILCRTCGEPVLRWGWAP